MALFEIWPRVPVRTHDHIALAVLVKIPKVPAFRPEMRREMMLGPSVDFVVHSGQGKGPQSGGQQDVFEHGQSVGSRGGGVKWAKGVTRRRPGVF